MAASVLKGFLVGLPITATFIDFVGYVAQVEGEGSHLVLL